MDDLRDRHVVITGGTGALGSAVVGLLLARGAKCHVPCWNQKELEHFPYRAHDDVTVVGGINLANEGDVAELYGALPELWASIQLAGGFEMSPLLETSLGELRRMFDLNTVTCFLCCREAVRTIRSRAQGRGGRIVNVAARPALVPTPGMTAYAISKSAVAALTLSLAEELRDDGIWVNAVVPSIMDTPANRKAMPDASHDEWPKVEEVAETIAYLASPLNRVTRGALVPVYGRS